MCQVRAGTLIVGAGIAGCAVAHALVRRSDRNIISAIMAACGTADLVVRHICAEPLPPYAPAFLLERYEDARYRAQVAGMVSGQL